MDRLKESVKACAEMYAHTAYLRSSATTLLTEYGTVEDALLMCMYLLTALKDLED